MVKSGQLMIRALALFVFTFLWLLIASADEWQAAQPIGVSSPSGRIVVRVLPGNSIGDVYGFSGAEKGEFATAIYYLLTDPGGYEPYQKATLQNPVAPVSAFLTDEGTLVTLDNWHNVGIDPVIVIYGSDGVLLRKYKLSDLYEQTQIESMPRSVSSIWWRCSREVESLCISECDSIVSLHESRTCHNIEKAGDENTRRAESIQGTRAYNRARPAVSVSCQCRRLRDDAAATEHSSGFGPWRKSDT